MPVSCLVLNNSIAYSIVENISFLRELCKKQNKCMFVVLKRGFRGVLRSFRVTLAVNQAFSVACF